MRSLHRTLLALAWISLAGAAQGQPSALFAGTTADVWLLSSDGETAAAYPVSSGTWTESITPTGLSFEVDHQRGTTSIAANPFAFAAVLVNQTQQSLPVLDRSIPPLSLRGLSGALGDEGTTQNPAVALAPDAGTYAETIRVTLRAVPPPGRSGPDVLILAWRDPAEPAFSSISGTLDDPPEQEFFFVRDGDHRLLYFAQAQDGALFRS